MFEFTISPRITRSCALRIKIYGVRLPFIPSEQNNDDREDRHYRGISCGRFLGESRSDLPAEHKLPSTGQTSRAWTPPSGSIIALKCPRQWGNPLRSTSCLLNWSLNTTQKTARDPNCLFNNGNQFDDLVLSLQWCQRWSPRNR